jgi:uncharacterized protein YdhG (YjbR/CyaY superfamily)
MPMAKPATIDEYIATFPAEVQLLLHQVRNCIKAAAPQATEMISYSVPAFKLNGMLVWFAAHSRHIGLYPRASAIEAFKEELSVYKGAKGSVQFPFDKPLPLALISRIVEFRLAENMQKVKLKKK